MKRVTEPYGEIGFVVSISHVPDFVEERQVCLEIYKGCSVVRGFWWDLGMRSSTICSLISRFCNIAQSAQPFFSVGKM